MKLYLFCGTLRSASDQACLPFAVLPLTARHESDDRPKRHAKRGRLAQYKQNLLCEELQKGGEGNEDASQIQTGRESIQKVQWMQEWNCGRLTSRVPALTSKISRQDQLKQKKLLKQRVTRVLLLLVFADLARTNVFLDVMSHLQLLQQRVNRGLMYLLSPEFSRLPLVILTVTSMLDIRC
uniref:G_PROTEIN_RECEP_F1_2 domain-containing protein n=1 Tax=Panagrellus redivivus TaxID=6233 RepID=A0A7E4ZY63_PANRE